MEIPSSEEKETPNNEFQFEARDFYKPLPHLSKNSVSLVGWMGSICVATLIGILVFIDYFFGIAAYSSLAAYLLLPMLLMGCVFLILLGVFLEWRRRHRMNASIYPALPKIDLNLPWQRRRIGIGILLGTLFLAFSSVGSYQAYHFTESPVFCGQVCHKVMKPEYTTYQHSPHARVACAECHIGSGADWYVKSKMSGLRQVIAMVTKSYRLPIPVPVANLRPARETCEECHWPAKFSDSLERVVWHFAADEANTPVRTNLLMKVGGGSPEVGQGHGIHWHINPNVRVRYWARDRQRTDIPWVETRYGDEPPKVYRSPECPDPLPEDAEIRVMDCVDCHNRPSHIYRSPRQLLDLYLSTGALSAALPFFKRYGMEVFEKSYPDTPTALKGIADVFGEKYAKLAGGPKGKEWVQGNVELLQTLYQRNFFPEQGVDWRDYPNNQGHFESLGCARCHDDRHATTEARTISNDCQICHQIVDQAEGAEALKPAKYSAGPYKHPRNLDTVWEGRLCTDCHATPRREPEARAVGAG